MKRAARNTKRRASPSWKRYLDEYIAAAGIGNDKDGPLFRTTGRSTGTPHRMTQQDAYRMIQRAGSAGGHQNPHRQSLHAGHRHHRLSEKRRLAPEARKMANHADTRTTQLYDRRSDAASLDEYGKVGI